MLLVLISGLMDQLLKVLTKLYKPRLLQYTKDMETHIGKTPYLGLGILYAPKSLINKGHVIINFIVWEINISWGKLGQSNCMSYL